MVSHPGRCACHAGQVYLHIIYMPRHSHSHLCSECFHTNLLQRLIRSPCLRSTATSTMPEVGHSHPCSCCGQPDPHPSAPYRVRIGACRGRGTQEPGVRNEVWMEASTPGDLPVPSYRAEQDGGRTHSYCKAAKPVPPSERADRAGMPASVGRPELPLSALPGTPGPSVSVTLISCLLKLSPGPQPLLPKRPASQSRRGREGRGWV